MIVTAIMTADMTIIPIAGIVMNAAGGRRNTATIIATGDAMMTGDRMNITITDSAATWKALCAEVVLFGSLVDDDRTIAGLESSARRAFYIASI